MPACAAIHDATGPTKGVTFATSASGVAAASAFHSDATLAPTTGTPATQSGGAGMCSSATLMSCRRAACSTMADTAATSGTTTSRSISSTITAVASQRRPPTARSSLCSAGQVATTIIDAQTSASRNGFITQKTPASSAPIRSTPNTMRVRSR